LKNPLRKLPFFRSKVRQKDPEKKNNELAIERDIAKPVSKTSENTENKMLQRLFPAQKKKEKEIKREQKKSAFSKLFSSKKSTEDKEDKESRQMSSFERFAYARISERLPSIGGYREIYEQAGMPLVYESYFATSILISAIIMLPSFLVSLLLEIRFLHVALVNAIVGSLLLGMIVFAVSISLWLIYPIQRRRTYKTKLDNRLAYSFGILGVLAASGMGLERLFERLIPTESNPVLADLASRLIRNIRIFGLDTESALKETAKHTPSPTFANMLESMAVAFKTTGSVTQLILYESARLFQEKRERLRKVINSLSLIAELYITAVVVGPIIFIVMMSVFGLLPAGGLPNPVLLINIIVFVGVPVLAVVFLIILDSTVSTL
jgi:flagellar protein FlaJ